LPFQTSCDSIEWNGRTVVMKEPEVDIDLVKEWALQAGKIALRHFNRVEGGCKEDRTLVTAADHEIEDLLTGYLRATYPEHGIIGEEGTREIHGEYVWAIDPLDGTRAFLAGLPIWGISIGLLWRGKPWLGVFYMPLLDEWYYSANPVSGAFWNDQPILCPVSYRWDENSLLCVPSDIHWRYEINFSGITRALGSAAAHLCYVARGSAVAALLGNPGIWDIAAGTAILQAAGGALRYLDGGEVELRELPEEARFQKPMLAAHPLVIERLAPLIKVRNTP
jgi:myo-inositol-1(or 4)-monophosphatase